MSTTSLYKKCSTKTKERQVDYNTIYKLRDQGLSLYKIMKALKCSLGTVQYALKVRNKCLK